MRKWIVALFIVALLAGPVFANQVTDVTIQPTTLNAATTSASGTTYVGDCDRVAFFVRYGETEVGGGVSATLTAETSYDGSLWTALSWYDLGAGPVTLQTSESFTSVKTYYGWFDKDFTGPQVRLTMTGTGTDSDDNAYVTAVTIKMK